MLGNLLGLNKYLLVGGAVVILGLGAFAGFTKWQLDSAHHTIELQTIEIRDKEAEISAHQFRIQLQIKAIDLLNDRLVEQQEEADQLNTELQEVLNVPLDQDGPVAPVLRGVFGR